MLWIKRNLFVVVFGAVAVALLAVGSLYVYSSVEKNKAVEEEVSQKKSDLERLYGLDPFPNATNINAAKQEQQRVQEIVNQAQKHFVPVPYDSKVTGLAFKTRFDETVAELHKLAEQAGVKLPPSRPALPYPFSFDQQQNKVTFAPGSFPMLAEQLAEVRALCLALFEAKISLLTGVRRAATPDDPSGSGSCLASRRHTNAEAGVVVSPYEVTFQAFSAELGAVMENLHKSSNGMVVRSISIEPVAAAATPPNTPPPGPIPPAPVNPAARAAAAAAARSALKTELNETWRRVTLMIDVVKTVK